MIGTVRAASWAAVLAIGLAYLSPGTARATDGVQRFALIVGANDGGPARERLRHAGADARHITRVLNDLGGLHDDDARTLVDPGPHELLQALAELASASTRARAAGRRSELVFYYSGHADERGLLLGTARVDYAALRTALQGFPADVRLGIVDACTSGVLTRQKGGTRRPGFVAGIAVDVRGMALLTSSAASEPAQESDRIGGSYFTHALVTGLRGGADVDRDGLVTLNEAYRFAFDETLASTETTEGGAQHPAFEIQLAGTGDLIVTDLRTAAASLELAPDLRGSVSVRDDEGRRVADIRKRSGDAVQIVLPAGRYQVTAADGDSLARADLDLRGRTRLHRRDLTLIPREPSVQRGDAVHYRVVPFNLSLVPPAAINTLARPHKVTNRAAFNIIAGGSDRLDGAEFGIGPNIVREDARGLQLGVVGSHVGRELRGLQLGLGFGYVGGTVTGVQQAGLFARARGVQGVQLALINIAGEVQGAQIGLINVATRRVTGGQLGVFNYAGHVAGAPIGVASVVRSGSVHADVWSGDTDLVHVGVRLRSRFAYSLIGAGLHPLPANPGWSLGFAVGAHVPLTRRIHIDGDLGWRWVNAGYRIDRTVDSLLQLRLMIAWRPRPRFGIYAGPTFNVFMPTRDPSGIIIALAVPPTRPGFGPNYVLLDRPGVSLQMWPGFVLGVEI